MKKDGLRPKQRAPDLLTLDVVLARALSDTYAKSILFGYGRSAAFDCDLRRWRRSDRWPGERHSAVAGRTEYSSRGLQGRQGRRRRARGARPGRAAHQRTR